MLGYTTSFTKECPVLFGFRWSNLEQLATAKRLAFTRVVIAQEFRRTVTTNVTHVATPPFVRTARGKSRG